MTNSWFFLLYNPEERGWWMRVDTLPPCRCEDFSLEVEARKHAERSKVVRVLPDPSIPDFGIPEDILYHMKRMLPYCSPGSERGATGFTSFSSSFHGTATAISSRNLSRRVFFYLSSQLRSAKVFCVMQRTVPILYTCPI